MALLASASPQAPPSLGTLLKAVSVGVICGFLAIVQSTGFGMLLLVGDAQSLAPTAIGMALFSTAVMAAVAALSKDYQSSNDTSEERREVLRSAGDAILIVRLQGFLFFGTADRLRKRIQQRIERHDGQPVRYLVVDFRRVSGLDSSTVLSFTRLAQMTGPGDFVLVLCGMSEAIRAAMMRGGLENGGAYIRFESDLDHGLEWCENGILNDVAPQVIGNLRVPVVDLLVDIVKDQPLAEALLPYLERIEVAPGDKLIEQDTPSDDIYFLEQGRAAVELETTGHNKLRVATVGRGSIVGEMAFYLGKPRSGSVIAETPLVAWRFSSTSLENLRRASPEAVIAFHRGMAGMLADRLTSTNQLVRLLAD